VCCFPNRQSRHLRRASRRGQALVEFAVVSLAVYLLLAAVLTFGQMLFCDQTLQQAADLAARELSRTPLPADIKFRDDDDPTNDVVHNAMVRKQVFDERYLVLKIDPDSNPITFNGGHPIGDFPLVNQQLLPLMVYQPGLCKVRVNADGSVTKVEKPFSEAVLHYPGAVFTDPNPDSTMNPPASGLLVRIPVVSISRYPATATESIVSFVHVLEEIPSTENLANGRSAFQVSSPQRGVVALRLNCPYQSAAMSSFQAADPSWQSGSQKVPTIPIEADDAISVSNMPTDVGDLVVSDLDFGAYSGTYGLGKQAAWAKLVRPYRSLFSAQAIYRREVFSSQ
jgi:hypothetical protein